MADEELEEKKAGTDKKAEKEAKKAAKKAEKEAKKAAKKADKENESDSDDDATESPVTKRLTMKARQQEEIVSVQAKDNQIKKWFNKIFN